MVIDVFAFHRSMYSSMYSWPTFVVAVGRGEMGLPRTQLLTGRADNRGEGLEIMGMVNIVLTYILQCAKLLIPEMLASY